jgi:xanthine dehydrogenase accessory factor
MFHEIQAALARGDEVALATVIKTSGAAPCAPGARLMVRAGGATSGTLGGAETDERVTRDALAAIASGQASTYTYHLDPDGGDSVGSCGATLEVFIEPLRPEQRLLIAGSGHVGQALARLAAPLGWRVALLDDRSEFAHDATLPAGIELAVGEMPDLLLQRQPDAGTWIVIATRGHRTDEEVLRAAVAGPTAYVGMIGSTSKVRNIFTRLLASGVAPDALARVHSPIGLDLGAETPDEIALSIAAEMLAVRRGATGMPLRERHALLAEAQAAAAERQARPENADASAPVE